MKLLTFLETIRENASREPGKFVGARLTRESERDIMRWMRDNGLRKKEPRARLHITVVGDKEQNFDWNPATFEPPLEVDPNSYKIEKFDDGAIVLSFSAPELEKRHEQAVKQHGINWKYPTYQPHITLSYDPTELNDIKRLLKPTFPIYIANEYEQPWEFNEDDQRSNRRRDTRIDEALLFERNVMNSAAVDIWVKTIADSMFGPNTAAPFVGTMHGDTNTIATSHAWAQKALRKFLINDAPAPRINSFQQDADSYPYPGKDVVGKASITWPRDAGTFGILSGHTKEKSLSVPHWLPDALERGEEVYWLDDRFINTHQGSFASVRDWFRHLAQHAPERLSPGRLSRMSWEQAEQAAFAWHDDMKASSDDGGNELEGDKEIYLEFGKGIAWWKLTGETCLTREGDLMGHCVADYLEDVQNGRSVILSLRDSKNQPHVTVEIENNNTWASKTKASVQYTDILQVKGKENKAPVKKYWKYVDELIKKLDADTKNIGTTGEGHGDLRECEITKIGDMLIRTDPPLDALKVKFTLVQHPPNREQEWYVHDGEEMELWEVTGELMDRYGIIPEKEYFDYSQDLENPAIQWIKWSLIQNGKWETKATTMADNVDYDDGEHNMLDPDDPSPWEDVPTRISISAPDIKYEILAGSPENYKFDINHFIASRDSKT